MIHVFVFQYFREALYAVISAASPVRYVSSGVAQLLTEMLFHYVLDSGLNFDPAILTHKYSSI